MTISGDSLYAVLYDSTRHRDLALRRLRATSFRHDSVMIALTVTNFGVIERSAIWYVPTNLMVTADQVRDAIIGLFKKKPDVRISFAIAPVLHKDVESVQ